VRRKFVKKGAKLLSANRDDAALSEKVVHLACSTWNDDLDFAHAAAGSASAEDIEGICKEFDSVSAMWSKLAVGESMTLIWRPIPSSKVRSHSKG
jgi:hypothetical protein